MQDLIPLVIRAVIVTLILITVLAIGFSIFGGTAAGNAVSQFNALSGAVQTAYSGQADFTGLTCATGNACAVLGNSIPANLETAAHTLGTNSWGGNITMAPAANPNGGADANADFTVAYASVPLDACIKIGEQLSGYAELTINGNNFIPGTANQATPTTLSAACVTGTNVVTVNYTQG